MTKLLVLVAALSACSNNQPGSPDGPVAHDVESSCRVVDLTTCNAVYPGSNLADVECDDFDVLKSSPPPGLRTCFIGGGLLCCAPE